MRPLVEQLEAPGVHFGKYRVLSRLAKGGMAELFLAKQVGLGGINKTVVLKCILPHLAQQEEFITMFLDEARLTAHLNHPHIVQVYEIDQFEGIYFITMEYIAGQSLRDFCLKLFRNEKYAENPPYDLFGQICAQAAEGLHFAHNATDDTGRPLGIVHRDTSPSNLIVSYSGNVKIIDFGVAKANSQVHQTRVGVLKGRLSHMAPELLTGQQADHRSDQFSLGVVLYELTTKRSLFQRETEGEIIQALLSDPIPEPTSFIEGYPPALEAILLKTLEREPELRYESCQELQQALATFAVNHANQEGLTLRNIMHELFASEQTATQKDISSGMINLNELSLFLRNTGMHGISASGSYSSYPMGTPSQTGMISAPPQESGSRWMMALIMLLLLIVGGFLGLYYNNSIRSPSTKAPVSKPLNPKAQIKAHITNKKWLQAADLLERHAKAAPDSDKAWITKTREQIQIGLKVELAEKLYSQGRYDSSRSILAKLVAAHTQPKLFGLSSRAAYLDNLLKQIKPAAPRQPERRVKVVPRPRARRSKPPRKRRRRRRRRRRRVASSKIKKIKKKAVGLLYVNVSPSAQVLLDGKMLGFTPINNKAIPAGEHRIELRARGHFPTIRNIEIREGKPLILNLRLKPIPKPRVEPRRPRLRPVVRRVVKVAVAPKPRGTSFLPFSRVRLPRSKKVRIYFTDTRGIAQRVYNPRALQKQLRAVEREVGRLVKSQGKTQGITSSWARFLKRSYAKKQSDFVTLYPRAAAYVIYRDLKRNRSAGRISQILILYQKRNRFRRYLSK